MPRRWGQPVGWYPLRLALDPIHWGPTRLSFDCELLVMVPGSPIDAEATTAGDLEAIEALVGETSSDLSTLVLGAQVAPSLVMRELTRVLSESADLLLLIGQDWLHSANLQLDELLQQDHDTLMNAPLLVG